MGGKGKENKAMSRDRAKDGWYGTQFYKRSYGNVPMYDLIGSDENAVWVKRPEPPTSVSDILFSEKKPKDQKWQHLTFPTDDQWRVMSVQQRKKIIDREANRRVNGLYAMIKGEIVYITGDFYFFLEYYRLEDGRQPSYRDRDRRFFMFVMLVHDDPLCLGMMTIKHRRVGDTSKILAVILNRVSSKPNYDAGLTSKTKIDAQGNLKKLVNSFNKLPTIARVRASGDYNATSALEVRAPKGRRKKQDHDEDNMEIIDTGLNSKCDHAATTVNAYDGQKKDHILFDEAAKLIKVPVERMWNIHRECFVRGAFKVGVAFFITTVGEMERNAGLEYERLWYQSNYYERNDNGLTSSALYSLFFPATDGLDGFIGPYGESIIDTPDAETWEWMKSQKGMMIDFTKVKKPIGALEYLMNRRKGMKDQSQLQEERRQYPLTVEEAFTPPSTSSPYHLENVSKAKALAMASFVESGNLEWVDGIRFGQVRFVPHHQGRWHITRRPREDANQISRIMKPDGWEYTPMNNDRYVIGIDPVDRDVTFTKKGQTKPSDHAICVFAKYDPNEKEMEPQYWRSYQALCVYQHRHQNYTDTVEDTVLTLWYYGTGAIIESQRATIVHDLKDILGMGKFILPRPQSTYGTSTARHSVDELGVPNSEPLKDMMVERGRDYTVFYWQLMKHLQIINDFEAIDVNQPWTPYDIFVAFNLCLVACPTPSQEQAKIEARRSPSKEYSQGFDLNEMYSGIAG